MEKATKFIPSGPYTVEWENGIQEQVRIWGGQYPYEKTYNGDLFDGFYDYNIGEYIANEAYINESVPDAVIGFVHRKFKLIN